MRTGSLTATPSWVEDEVLPQADHADLWDDGAVARDCRLAKAFAMQSLTIILIENS